MVPKPLQCDHGLRRQTIVASLIGDVFQGRLKAGQRLVTQELSERFGVSHTPIREALIALAGIGIIDLVPNRGAIVRKVSSRDVREICSVRRALECTAAAGACGRADLAQLQVLASSLEQLQHHSGVASQVLTDQARDVDSQLHDLIATSCGNQFLGKELNRLKILFRAFRDLSWEHYAATINVQRIIQEADEHLAIVRALQEGSRKRAHSCMSEHIRSGMRYWTGALRGEGSTASGIAPI